MTLFLFLLFAGSSCSDTSTDLKAIVTKMGFTVTSERGGRHNVNSRHYEGKAIDVRSTDKTELEVTILEQVMRNHGYVFRDERKRPKGQLIWHGAHLHLAIPFCQ